MRKNLFLYFLLTLAFCAASCNDSDENILSRAQEPSVAEFSDDTVLISEKAASDKFNVFETGGFLLTGIEKEIKQSFSDGSMMMGYEPLFEVNYIIPKILNEISIVSKFNKYTTYKFNLYYSEPTINFDSGYYYDCTIDYTPEGFIAGIGLKDYKGTSGNTFASSTFTIYSYHFSYDDTGRLVEYNKTVEEEESTDTQNGTSNYKSTTDSKTTLTWEEDNISRILITTHYISENLNENTKNEYDYVSDYTITYSEKENPGQQYCIALTNLIVNNDILNPCALIGLLGSGTRNVPVNISGINSNREFNQDISLTFTEDINGNLLIDTEQWPAENQDENNFTIYHYQYKKLVNSQVPKIYND